MEKNDLKVVNRRKKLEKTTDTINKKVRKIKMGLNKMIFFRNKKHKN